MSGIGVTGDFAKLAALRGRMRSAGKLKAQLIANLAAEAETQVALGFRGSRDPYGNPWAPLAYRDGLPLVDTARLKNSFTTTKSAEGFRIGTNVVYASVHQHGGRVRKANKRASRGRVGRIPARPMLPTGELGPIWTKAFRKAADSVFRKFWR